MNSLKDLYRYLRIFILRLFTLIYSEKKWSLPQTILIIAPHPDDEVLGCAGLIQKLITAGKEVHVIILSGGEASHNGCCPIDKQTLINERRQLSIKAAKLLNLSKEHLHFLNYPDGDIKFENPETIQLKELIHTIQPNAIFVPHDKEGWSDHIEAQNIIRKLISEETSTELYEYCVWFWYYNSWNIDWKNGYLIKMNSAEHQLKNKAINAYIYPKASCGKPWSGDLPRVFVKANRWNKELYFKLR
jgi:LmbE family N-acetylglucosaminyl deacetylase